MVTTLQMFVLHVEKRPLNGYKTSLLALVATETASLKHFGCGGKRSGAEEAAEFTHERGCNGG